jgi:ferredoxin
MDQVRVKIDQELCMSSGRCLADIPEAFAFDDDELAFVLPAAASVGLDRLRAAARTCPGQAIAVELGTDG